MSWVDLASWWRSELSADAAYETVVTPLLLEVLPTGVPRCLDLGSGDGRVIRTLADRGIEVYGFEIAETLASFAGSTVVADITSLPVRSASVACAYTVLVVEHLANHRAFFTESARVVRAGGHLAIVSNHSVWTAPGSTPIQDETGEVLWRPGAYFDEGSTDVEVEGGVVTFHHRSMAGLLNAAADAGWSLEKMIERPHHGMEDQSGIPRLLACRWRLLP